jgi:hypothetical protein
LVIFKPNTIAQVGVATAERAFPEVPGLAQSPPGDLPAHAAPARSRFVDGHDRGHLHLSKKIRPRFPEARSHTARGVHPAARPSWFYIVTAVGAFKPLTVAPQDQTGFAAPYRSQPSLGFGRHGD